ncbi:MAG TPA: prepilin-type N-terminal cleavage/methylation domain-containing protein [Candidatus Paceibacterota bacterium]|nr:prepilin-type N-terminal cleavage/methylation domain-containing protein [Candidatus Paceibacterota bacterium]
MKTNNFGLLLQKFRNKESGFGIIEVVVSMFLLGMMSVSFVPLLLNSWKDTSANTTIATATQIVNEQIEGARAVRSASVSTPSCADIIAYLQVTLPPVIDPRGVTLQPEWNPTTCPTMYPGVVRASVEVSRVGVTTPIASAVTFIYVGTA